MFQNKLKEEIFDLVKNILLEAGADLDNSACVAEHLVDANLCGVDTHGVWQLPDYIEAIKQEQLLPAAKPEILKETATSALVSGNWTFGQVAAKFGMETAIVKARGNDIAVVSLVQMHHTGRMGFYVEMAAAENMVALIFAGGYGRQEPVAVPYGGSKSVLHTNPVAMGFPNKQGAKVVLDYATTTVSGVKIKNALTRNEQLLPGTIVDKKGNPTTDPQAFFEGGGLLPFGDQKGYALMVIAELLGAVMPGCAGLADERRGGAVMRYQGATMIVFKANLFLSTKDLHREVDELTGRIRAVPPAKGFSEVLLPGDMESRTRSQRLKEGIPIDESLWRRLMNLQKQS